MDNATFRLIKKNIESEIVKDLDRLGVYYRIHSRIKTIDSLNNKIQAKGEGYYRVDGKKVQDIIGFRITTYFIEDVDFLWDFFSKKYQVVDKEYDVSSSDVFKPLRKNLVCRFSAENLGIFDAAKKLNNTLDLVDNTFEMQFRTTSSEGWHEVDHALRYKYKGDWDGFLEEDRMFNGIYAILETTDRTLRTLFDHMTYNQYKSKNWEAMLRMKFYLNFEMEPLNESIKQLLNTNKEVAKKIIQCKRSELLLKVALSGLHAPVTFNNVVFLINYLYINNPDMNKIAPKSMLDEFKRVRLVSLAA